MTENQNDKDKCSTNFINAIKYWRANPDKYIQDILLKKLNVQFEPRQKIALETIFRDKKVLIPAHFSFGKSFLCALIALAIPNLYPHNSVGSTFAPTFRQVRDILWREMRRIFDKVNDGEVILAGSITATRYTIGTGALVVGFSPNKGSKAGGNSSQSVSGRHDKVVFIIIDEAGGVSKNVFEQIEALQSSGEIVYVVCIGNPLDINGEFGQLCTTEKGEGYTVLHFTAYTSENMKANGLTSLEAIRTEAMKLRALSREERRDWYRDKYYKKPFPFLISCGFVMEKYLKWGESPLFFSYCIGEWSQVLENTLITLSRASECMLGTFKNETGDEIWISEENGLCQWNEIKELFVGVDCADEGADKNVVFALEGNREFYVKEFQKTYTKDEVDFRGTRLVEDGEYIAKHIFDNLIYPNPIRIIKIGIDCTGGFGKSIYENLIKMKFDSKFVTIRKVHFGEKALDTEQFNDIIAEMAWSLAGQINSRAGLLLKQDDDLKNQLTNRRKVIGSKYRNRLEPKALYKARAGASPDKFDALMIANYMSTKDEGVSDNTFDALLNTLEKTSEAIKGRQNV